MGGDNLSAARDYTYESRWISRLSSTSGRICPPLSLARQPIGAAPALRPPDRARQQRDAPRAFIPEELLRLALA